MLRRMLPPAATIVASLLVAGCGHWRGDRARAALPAQPAPAAGAASVPTGAPSLGERAVWFARSQQGRPYCWGGTGPSCFDCSGLVHAAWGFAGRQVPRTSADMHDELPAVALDEALPGDIAWRTGHVGLYVGAGWVIHSPSAGKTVSYEPVGKYAVLLRP